MKYLHSVVALLLFAAPRVWAFDDPPADPTLAGDQARAVGEAVKQNAKVIADAAQQGAQQVASVAKEVGHEVAAASREGAEQIKQGAQQVAGSAKRGGQQVKATVAGDKAVKSAAPKQPEEKTAP